MHDTKISIVIPVYKGKDSLRELYNRLKNSIESITNNFEIIFVEDNGNDGSWNIITELSKRDKRVKGFKLSRNFGQHYSISAGLDHSKGEWIFVMDCDLQDQPEEITKLYKKALEGYDIVFAKRIQRQDNIVRKLSSRLFYKTLSYLTDTFQDGSIANFGIYNRKVINIIVGMKESFKYFPVAVRWVGFNSTSIEVEHAKRKYGETTYSFKKLLNLSISVMLAFSDKPLRLVLKLGIIISFCSFIYAIYIIARALLGIQSIQGWPSLVVSIWFLSGIIIFIIGVVGLYIGKIFNEVKNRPNYIIEDDTFGY